MVLVCSSVKSVSCADCVHVLVSCTWFSLSVLLTCSVGELSGVCVLISCNMAKGRFLHVQFKVNLEIKVGNSKR